MNRRDALKQMGLGLAALALSAGPLQAMSSRHGKETSSSSQRKLKTGNNMKVIIINGSPRKGWNTDLMLKEAEKGAIEAGAETEYVNLYDLQFSGCKSCFACKVRDGKSLGHCAINDGLKPILDKIDAADALIMGSPIYFSDITAECRAFFERLMFQYLNYEGQRFNDGKLKVGVIYTMNAPEGYMDYLYKNYERLFGMFFNYVGHVAATETLQTNNYDRYYLGKKSEQYKLERREKQFPIDLKNAFDLGKKIVTE